MSEKIKTSRSVQVLIYRAFKYWIKKGVFAYYGETIRVFTFSNKVRKFFSDSPTHLSNMSAPFLWKNDTFPIPSLLISDAKAPATRVLPVPKKSNQIDDFSSYGWIKITSSKGNV